MSYSRNDVRAGRVTSKTLKNGVIVAPCLQIGSMTLAEHQSRCVETKSGNMTAEEAKLTRDEARKVGHPDNDIMEWFGT